jgi:hypothetical protein
MPSHRETFSGENARRTGRIRVRNIRCTLGDVVDISPNGLRVAVRGAAPSRGLKLRMRVQGPNQAFEVDAQVVWVAQVGGRAVHIGVCFENASSEVRSELLAMAREAPMDITHKD